MQTIPILSTDLIKKLDELYPPIRPSDDISDRELWGRIYQRRLVDNLQYLANPPEDNETD
jgi:hypothetical protein